MLPSVPAARKFIPTAEWHDARHRRGLRGERLALAYLTSCGWSIEAHRFRVGRHEIDLVARRGGVVAFVKVKTRRPGACGGPIEAVDRRKQGTIARVAAVWRLRYGRRGDEYRFDVVAVVNWGGGSFDLEHVADALRISR